MQAALDSEPAARDHSLDRMLGAYHRLSRLRDRAAGPITGALVRLGVTADTLSVLSVAVMLPVVFAAGSRPWLCAGCVLASTIADQLDGAVARVRRAASDRGKLVDVVCDNLGFTLYVLGLVVGGLIAPPVAVLVVYTMVLSKALRLAVHAFSLPSPWLFRPVAGFLPNAAVAVMYLLYLPYAAGGRAPFGLAGALLAAMLALDALSHLLRLLRARVSAGAGRDLDPRR